MVVVVVVVTARFMSPGMFTATWGSATLLNGAGGESESEFPSDPEIVLSFSSITTCFKWTERQSGCITIRKVWFYGSGRGIEEDGQA